MNPYQQPMQPWPGLEGYARQVVLPSHGRCIYMYEAGPEEAPAMLLLHGLGDEADTWRHVFAPLAGRYHVLAPDLPGFGRSAAPPGKLTPFALQANLLELLDVLGVAQAVLVGHSLGAMLAQALALNNPGRFPGLVLIGGSLLFRERSLDPKSLLYLLPGVGEWLYTRLRRNPQEAYETLRPFYGDLDGLPEAERSFLFQRVNERVWSDSQRSAYLATMRSMAGWITRLQNGLDAHLAASQTPTLALWGERDRMNPVANGRMLADVQPTVRLEVFPGAGHNLAQERPEAVVRAILRDERLPG